MMMSAAEIIAFEKECERLNVERYQKALHISEIMRLFSCTYTEAEGIYYIEKHTAKHTPPF